MLTVMSLISHPLPPIKCVENDRVWVWVYLWAVLASLLFSVLNYATAWHV